ncbi:MAG: hypothetical protein KAX38_05380 [Candidatus Krumholzibacteria bacterium]|nr:hypothetical protein [Candidatus Krumholzibacteria bacterium]
MNQGRDHPGGEINGIYGIEAGRLCLKREPKQRIFSPTRTPNRKGKRRE